MRPVYRNRPVPPEAPALVIGVVAAYFRPSAQSAGPYILPNRSAEPTLDLTPAWIWWADTGAVSRFRHHDDRPHRQRRIHGRGLVTTAPTAVSGGSCANGITSLASGVDQGFRVYGVSAQARFALTPTMATTVAYFHYKHRYSNPDALPAGFPAEYHRNAVRVGLTLWVPLAGTSSPPPLIPR